MLNRILDRGGVHCPVGEVPYIAYSAILSQPIFFGTGGGGVWKVRKGTSPLQHTNGVSTTVPETAVLKTRKPNKGMHHE